MNKRTVTLRELFFYTDMDNATEDGKCAPMLGIMEKFRKSISILFWGTCVLIAVFYQNWRRKGDTG